jgi:hypothetical protein
MADKFSEFRSGLDSPAEDGFAITPNNTTDLATSARSIYVGGAGDVVLDTVKGTTLTFSAVPAGFILPVRANRVRATGTTATLLIGLV